MVSASLWWCLPSSGRWDAVSGQLQTPPRAGVRTSLLIVRRPRHVWVEMVAWRPDITRCNWSGRRVFEMTIECRCKCVCTWLVYERRAVVCCRAATVAVLRAPRADLRFVVPTCPSSASRHIARHLRVYIREGCVANLSVSSVTATVFAISSSAPPSSPSHTPPPSTTISAATTPPVASPVFSLQSLGPDESGCFVAKYL